MIIHAPVRTEGAESSSGERAPGRPRSERAHKAILLAALQLLAERGYERLTMEAIAEHAGVGKATIYRRWNSKEKVLAAAVAGFVSENTLPDSGSIETDLFQLVRGAAVTYRGLPGRIMPGLISAMAQDAALAQAVRTGFLARRRAALRTVIVRGIRRGELREDIDVELTLDFLGGPLFFRLLISGQPIDDEMARGTVDMMLRGMLPGR